MRYSMGKRIQQEKFLGAEMKFNPIEFRVDDCETKEQAELEVDTWIREYFKAKLDKIEEVNNNKDEKTKRIESGDIPF